MLTLIKFHVRNFFLIIVIRSLLISRANGSPIMNWSYDDDNSSSKNQILLAGSIISAIQVYAREVLYSRVQTIEMDKGFLFLKGDTDFNEINSLNTKGLLVISAFTDKNDNHYLVDRILTEILDKVKGSAIEEDKFIQDDTLSQWITDLLKRKSKIRDNKTIFLSSIFIFLSFLISTLFIGFNYSFYLQKNYEESLQTILGLLFGVLFVTPSCYLAGDRIHARIACILTIPISFFTADFLIRSILTSQYWEQSLGDPFIFLGYLFFVCIIGSQIGSEIAEKRYLFLE